MADLELAEAAYREADLADAANLTIHNRGYTMMLAGDLVAALQTMQSVREPLDDESELWAAVNELDRAEVLREAGLVTEAERSLESVSHAFGRHHAPRDRATAEYNLARSLLSHDPERAARAASSAVRHFRSVGSPGWSVRAEAILLRARLAVGRVDRAGAPVRVPRRLPTAAEVADVVDSLRAHGFDSEAEALRLTDAARANPAEPRDGDAGRPDREHNTLGDGSSCSRGARRARGCSRTGGRGPAPRRARTRPARGHQPRRRQPRPAGVSGHARLGADPIGTVVRRALGPPGRGLRVVGARPHDEPADPPVRPPPDPEQAADLAELRVLRAAAADGDWLAGPRAAVLRDRARRAAVVAHRCRRGPRARIAPEVLNGLGGDDVLLSYVFDGVRLTVLVVVARPRRTGPTRLAGRAIGAQRVAMPISTSRPRSGSGPWPRSCAPRLESRLAALSTLLVEPMAHLLRGSDRVVLTAPGVLAGVPWTMLPALRARVLTVAPSASGWLRDRSDTWRAPTSAGFAAGPRVARGDEEVQRAGIRLARSGDPRRRERLGRRRRRPRRARGRPSRRRTRAPRAGQPAVLRSRTQPTEPCSATT